MVVVTSIGSVVVVVVVDGESALPKFSSTTDSFKASIRGDDTVEGISGTTGSTGTTGGLAVVAVVVVFLVRSRYGPSDGMMKLPDPSGTVRGSNTRTSPSRSGELLPSLVGGGVVVVVVVLGRKAALASAN